MNYSRRILLDNQFRFWISLSTFVIAALLSSSRSPATLLFITLLFILYNGALGLSHLQSRRGTSGAFLQYSLITLDLLAITSAIDVTGNIKSPLYILYLVVFGVCMYHQNLSNFVFSVVLGILLFSGMVLYRSHVDGIYIHDGLAQILLLMMLTGVFSTVLRMMKKERYINQRLISQTLTMGKIADLLSAMSDDPQEMVRTVSKLIEEEMGPEGIKCRTTLHRPDQAYLPPSGGRMGVHIPIVAGESIFGTFIVTKENQEPLSPSEQNFFSSVARSLGVYLHRARLWEDNQVKSKQAEVEEVSSVSQPRYR